MKRGFALVCALAFTSALSAQTYFNGDQRLIEPPSTAAHPGLNHSNYLLLSSYGRESAPGNHPFSSSILGYYPSDILNLYNIPAGGGGEAIAIVAPYDYPAALADFNVFSRQFGLPRETSNMATASANQVFQVAYAAGTEPSSNASWQGEMALDMEWAHAIAPNAKIYLVEANSEAEGDLDAAVQAASGLANVKEVCIPWGTEETPSETSLDSTFVKSGVVFFAAAGDDGNPNYPSESPNVVSVGGTSFVPLDGNAGENAWFYGGGGPSAYEPKPGFQNLIGFGYNGTGFIPRTVRSDPDVSALADPLSGVAVYSSSFGSQPWAVAGGTSLSTVIEAGVTNDRENASGTFADSSIHENLHMYGNVSGAYFHDISFGTTGYQSASPGYDMATGIGTPDGLLPPWPKFHANAVANGFGLGSGASNIEKWTAKTNGMVESSPAIGIDGTVYVGSDDGNVYAVDGATGIMKWRFATGGPVKSSPAIAPNGLLYVGSSDDKLYAINAATGVLSWTYATGGSIVVSPTIAYNGIVFAGSMDGTLYLVDGTTGATFWTEKTGGGIESSPVFASGQVYYASDDGYVYALDPPPWGGQAPAWKFQTSGPIQSALTVGYDQTIYAVSADGTLYAINFGTAAEIWSLSFGSPVISSPMAGPGGSLFVGCANGNLYSINQLTGAQNWVFATGGPVNSSPALDSSSIVYVGSNDGNLYAVSGVSGNEIWAFPTSGEVTSSPAIGADGTIYVGSNDGNVYAIGSSMFAALAAAPSTIYCGGSTIATLQLQKPVLSTGITVQLASDNSTLTVPSAVHVNGGQTQVTFPVQSKWVATPQTATLTAALNGSEIQTTITVNPSSFTGFFVSPSAVTGRYSTSGVVQLKTAAGSSGATISLATNNSCASVPASVTIPAGGTGKSFTVTTSAVSAGQTVTLSATLGAVTVNTYLTLNPYALSNFYVSPATVAGGVGTRGVVQSAGPTGPSGDQVLLSSDNPAVAVPVSVTIPAGGTGVSFPISTTPVASSQTAHLTATFNGDILTTTMHVSPPLISSFYVAPDDVAGGTSAHGVVQLTGPAPAGGFAVALVSGSGSVALPSTVTVPRGANGVSFVITTKAVSITLQVQLDASANGQGKDTTLTLSP